MPTAELVVEVQKNSVGSWRAARFLRTCPDLRVRIVSVGADAPIPAHHVLRIESATAMDAAVTLLWRSRTAADEPSAAALGLSPYVLAHYAKLYEWSAPAHPLSRLACLGTPSPDRPWLLVARSAAAALDSPGFPALEGAQVHYWGIPKTYRPGQVAWWPTSSILLSLLGHVDAVVAPLGPLCWDAQRLGVPVLEPRSSSEAAMKLARRRLACVVPAALVGQQAFWRSLGRQLAETTAESAWGTDVWVLRSRHCRAQAAAELGGAAWQQKLLKLRRDPRRFWADSILAKRFQR